MWLGNWQIDDVLTFPANTHNVSTGAAADADAVPAYRIYEDETGTAILTGNTAKLDDANTVGFYTEQITLSAANGFENGKTYTIYLSAAVSSVTGTQSHTFSVGVLQRANVVQISDDSTAADNLESACDNYSATRGLAGTALPAAAADASGGLVISDAGGLDIDALRADITGGAYALDTDANGRVRVVDGTGAGEIDTSSGMVQLLAATQASIDAIETDTNSLNDTKVPDTISLAAINAEVDTAIETYGLDHLLSASVTGTDVTDNSIVASLVSKEATADWDDFVNTTDSLQAIRDKQTDIETDTAEIGAAGAGLTALATAASIAALNDLSQTEVTGGAYSLDTDANGRIRIVDGTGAGELDTSSGLVQLLAATQASIDAIETDTNSLNDTKIPNTISLANINAQMVDVLQTDTLTELGVGQPSATPTFETALMALYGALTNKVTQTAAEFGVHNSGGTKIWTKATSDDATTYTEAGAASA